MLRLVLLLQPLLLTNHNRLRICSVIIRYNVCVPAASPTRKRHWHSRTRRQRLADPCTCIGTGREGEGGDVGG